ncbi:MAG: hypothetical protein IKE70_02580 [Bacilli bacterium]|nr:hypothetical protein [Bacilli bacterium]
MKERYSKTEDCYDLAYKLKKELKKKIDFYGTMYTPIPSGKYLSTYRRKKGEHFWRGNYLPFYFKFERDDFLRISVGSNHKGSSLGEKLAALSDFNEVLQEEFGPPNFFYTLKNDKEELLSLQWSFKNKEEDLCFFKYGNFTDAKKDDVIIIGEENKEDDQTIKIAERKVGLPYELFDYVYEDLEEFVKHKKGEEVIIPKNARVDGLLTSSFEKRLK